MIDTHQAAAKRHHQAVSAEEFPHKQLLSCAYVDQVGGTSQFSQSHYRSILWQTLGKNPILVGYVVLGIGYG